MKLKHIIEALESWAPKSLQESYDNSGLLVGNPSAEVSKALICLDCTEEILAEAKQTGCDLIIAHHPIVFSGLKSFTGRTYIERVVMDAIKSDIAIYAIHTNLDNITGGVNSMISEKLGLLNSKILVPKGGLLEKLVVYTPESHKEQLLRAMFDAGAGQIGAYDECSFSSEGVGTFRANQGAKPFSGEIGIRKDENEVKLEVVVTSWNRNRVVSEMLAAHPYEEVAYDIYQMEREHQQIGAGMIGELPEALGLNEFFDLVKKGLHAKVIRHTNKVSEKIRRVAVCGGSGSFLLPAAIRAKADVFLTADFKYHQFFDAESKIVITDIGHYESEHLIIPWIGAELTRKFPNFAIHLTKVNTNPVKYY